MFECDQLELVLPNCSEITLRKTEKGETERAVKNKIKLAGEETILQFALY